MFSLIFTMIYQICCLGGGGERGNKHQEKTVFDHIVDNLEHLAEAEIEFLMGKFEQKKKKAKHCC